MLMYDGAISIAKYSGKNTIRKDFGARQGSVPT